MYTYLKLKANYWRHICFAAFSYFFPISHSQFFLKKYNKIKLQPPLKSMYLMPTHPEYPSHTFMNVKKNIFHIYIKQTTH